MEVLNDLRRFHLFTHAGCMDGSACSILFQRAGGLKENVHYIVAGRVDQFLADQWERRWDTVPLIMVDIAPTNPISVDFLSHRSETVIIDHHSSNAGLAGTPNFIIDVKNDACGCENFRRWLVRNHFEQFEEPWFKRFTALVDDHDRWILQNPESLNLAKLLGFLGQKDFVERFYNVEARFALHMDTPWTQFEKDLIALINRRQAVQYRSMLNKMQVLEKPIDGRNVKIGYVISDEINNSEMLNYFLEQRPEIEVAVQINFGLQKVAMRSRNPNPTVDVARLCRQFGGGGHATASAHPLPPGLIKEILERMHK
jgi:oligoribonuclease NrnB/cAMP/cGMP phosphodiesterase (DHH superfamily)